MNKAERAKYIDNVIVYLNDLLDIADKPGRGPREYPGIEGAKITSPCGMCWALAAAHGEVNCFKCPISVERTDRFCDERPELNRGEYHHATPEQIIKRVKWIAKQVNKMYGQEFGIHIDEGNGK